MFNLFKNSFLVVLISFCVASVANKDKRTESQENTFFNSCIDKKNEGVEDEDLYCKRKEIFIEKFDGGCVKELTTASFSKDKKKKESAEKLLDLCTAFQEDWKSAQQKCRKKLEAQYDAQREVLETPGDEVKEEEAEKFTRRYEKCEERYGDSKDNSKCKEESDSLKDLRKEFSESCQDLGGPDACIKTVDSCEKCDFSEEAAEEGLDCVLIRNQATCPQLANNILDDLKEEKEDYEDKIQDLSDKLAELKEDKIRLEGELNDEKLEYEADIKALKSKQEEIKEELKSNLEENKEALDGALKAALAKVQEEMGKSQQIQFELSNAIAAVNRKYRDERNKVFRGCQQESAEKLATYRKARKAAIRAGQFKQESISQMLQENRVTFAQKDDVRYFRYYNNCVVRNRYLLQSLREDLKDGLRAISQKKELIASQFEAMQAQLAALNKEARAKGQKSIEQYVIQLDKVIRRFKEEFDSRTKTYAQRGLHLNKQLSEKTLEISKTEGLLRETKNKFNHNREMYNRLRASGASSEDKSSQLGEASGSYTVLKEEWNNAFNVCECDDEEEAESKECDRIKKVGKLVEPDHEVFWKARRKKRKSSSAKGTDDQKE